MKTTALFVYHAADHNMLETCIHSLRRVNTDCTIIVFHDTIPAGLCSRLENCYGAVCISMAAEQMVGRRALCKVEVYCRYGLFSDKQSQGEVVLVSDVDVIFIDDPFVPMVDNPSVDLGLTSRGYASFCPINAGIVYYRVGEAIKNWLKTHLDQSSNPTWDFLIQKRKEWGHEKFGPDWTVGQDFINCWWIHNNEKFWSEPCINAVDFGSAYNFCPARDIFGEKVALQMARDAYVNRSVHTLHLKSSLKKLIYTKDFADVAITKYLEPAGHEWRKEYA